MAGSEEFMRGGRIVETICMLVTVKAYPAVGNKNGEAVCVAGIDVNTPRWIRLYPVPFRDLPNPTQFKKYQTIELKARKANDPRPESYSPNTDTLRLVGKPLAAGESRQRRKFVEPLVQDSMCAVRRLRESQGMSLAVFQQHGIEDLEIEEDRTPWRPEQLAHIDQGSLLMPGKTQLEKVPYRFRYVYNCEGEAKCPTHHQSIIDWEIGEAFRNFRDKYGTEKEALEKIREKWAGQMWTADRDTFFYTGNNHENPDGFMVLGVFWPKKLPV